MTRIATTSQPTLRRIMAEMTTNSSPHHTEAGLVNETIVLFGSAHLFKWISKLLFCSVLFCSVPFCFLFCSVFYVLFCFVLFCSVPLRSVTFSSVYIICLFCSVPFCYVQFHFVLFGFVPFYSCKIWICSILVIVHWKQKFQCLNRSFCSVLIHIVPIHLWKFYHFLPFWLSFIVNKNFSARICSFCSILFQFIWENYTILFCSNYHSLWTEVIVFGFVRFVLFCSLQPTLPRKPHKIFFEYN